VRTLGKSTLLCEFAARITSGQPLPDGQSTQPRAVIILSAEDNLHDTIRPRIDAGGDPSHIVSLLSVPVGRTMDTLPIRSSPIQQRLATSAHLLPSWETPPPGRGRLGRGQAGVRVYNWPRTIPQSITEERKPMPLNLEGLIPATALPMTADAEIDEPQLRRYIRWVADQGPVALAINADTGEGPHLTHREKVQVVEIVADELKGQIPIVAGLGGPFTRQAVESARDFKSAGADAFLVFPISAYLSAPLDPQVPVRYHQSIAEVGLPMILFQLQPALGGVNYDADILTALASIDGVVAIKEASFDARRFIDLAHILEALPRPITLLTGNDNFIYESFVLGAQGALIGFGAIMTREQVRMIEAWQAGRIDEAKELGRRVQRLADVIFAAPVGDYRARLKEALVMLGAMDTAYVREPLLPISDEQRDIIRRTLAEVGLAAQVAA
jgi:4-hydroxy-tetrahydrodipicolinate synthase